MLKDERKKEPNYEKRSSVIAAILSILLLGGTTVSAYQKTDSTAVDGNAVTAIVEGEDNNYVLKGAHDTTLLVDSISSNEYEAMMGILYPNGVVDKQGQDIPEIENASAVRVKFIAEHMKAYSMAEGVKTEVQLAPFTISITDQSNGTYSALFYRASIGKDQFVFPSEWGNQSFGFTQISDKNIYLAFTDMGIWRIDPDSETATKITADTYLGEKEAEVSEKVKERFPEGYLMWIDSVAISPNGEYVVYRTNRDSASLNETSLWKISLSSGTEEQFVAPAINNDIVGFITDNDAVVGALKDTRIIDVTDNKVVTIKTPELPNFCVKSVKAGKIVISSYEDGSSDTTTYIDNVNEVTGAMSEITKVSGYLDGEPQFAPSGNKLAIGYGTDAMVGVNDVMVVDVANNVQSLLTDSIPTAKGAHTINSTITRCLWINDDTLLVDTQQENTLPAVESAPPTALVTNPYDIVFGNTPPSIVNFNSPLSTTSTSGFVAVNSKWNQPRNVNGSNPHNGVDLQAALNTNVYAPYPGWATGITGAGPYDIQFLVDANKNGVQDDGDYYIRFYHLNYLITISYQQNNSVNVPPTQFICVGVQNLI